ncbi:MAG: hypothetical protein JSS40_18250 [Proteobacteria bacterium]|nr:hypothetical protein [Pseudomonadota bacterium]
MPLRYFGEAVVLHFCAWVLAWDSAGTLAGYTGGFGAPLAALHAMTLGVAAMAAMGASLQLLPIATRQPVRSVALAKLAWWLFTPGVLLLVHAMAFGPVRLAGAGAMLVAAGLAVYAYLLFHNLRNAKGMPVVVAHGWAALACLAMLGLSGLALVAHYEHGFGLDLRAFALLHLAVAAYGFMGLLAFGVSYLLLPMFALSPPPAAKPAYAALALALGALACAALGTVFGLAILLPLAPVLGLAAVALHVRIVLQSLARRAKADPGRAFILVYIAWSLLAASLALGALVAWGVDVPRGAALFGVLLVPGWLLSLVLGILQRIAPFLVSVHVAAAPGQRAPLPSALAPGGALAVHFWCHLAALGLLLAGVAADVTLLVRAAALAGAAGALSYAVFFAILAGRLRQPRVAAAALQRR